MKLDFDVKFPLLRLLQFLSDSKSTNFKQGLSVKCTMYIDSMHINIFILLVLLLWDILEAYVVQNARN